MTKNTHWVYNNTIKGVIPKKEIIMTFAKEIKIEKTKFVERIELLNSGSLKCDWSITAVCENDYEVCKRDLDILKYSTILDGVHFSSIASTALEIYLTFKKAYPELTLKLNNLSLKNSFVEV